MKPEELYDLSFDEWADKLEGYQKSQGVGRRGALPTQADFQHLEHRMGPSRSIRA